MEEHPSSSELIDFLAGEYFSRAHRREIVRHLLAGCPRCRYRLSELSGRDELPRLLDGDRARQQGENGKRSPPASVDYDAAFTAAERTFQFFFSCGKPSDKPPGALLAELGGLSQESAEDVAALAPERAALPFLVRWLIEKSHSCRYLDPDEMLQWGIMGRLAAQTCSARIVGSGRKLADLRALAEAQVANALRLLGRSEEASEVMRAAFDYLSEGTGTLETRACLLQKAASLLTLQHRFELGLECLAEAGEIFSYLELEQERVKSALIRANAYRDFGQSDCAVSALEDALPAVDIAEDVDLPLLARNNLAACYIDVGRHARALAMIREAPRFIRDPPGQESLILRLHWQEARVLVALGRPEAARRGFARARAGFLKQGLLYELCAVTYDFISLQRELGEDRASAACLVAETGMEVERRRSGPEVGQALQQLRTIAL